MSGKGSKPRPLSIPRNQFEDNWNQIFKKKKQLRDNSVAECRTHNPKVGGSSPPPATN